MDDLRTRHVGQHLSDPIKSARQPRLRQRAGQRQFEQQHLVHVPVPVFPRPVAKMPSADVAGAVIVRSIVRRYPAGFAGGHVPSRAPDTAAQYVQADLDIAPDSLFQQRGVTVAFFAVEKTAEGGVKATRRVRHASEIPAGQSVVAFRLRRASGNPWTGGFPYVDLTNPQTALAFLETTYESYKKHVGDEFGNTVRWAFTDEPLLATGGAYDSAKLALPLSYHTLAEFQKRNGYDLADQIASLFWDVGDFRRVRFDYWQTLHDLWKENFMQPMFEWSDRNNIQLTGHWMEHEWPYPWISPDNASLYAFQHVPGIDMLEGTNLRTKGKDPHLLFTIKQVASVAHQLGRRAFCEAYGVAGWDSPDLSSAIRERVKPRVVLASEMPSVGLLERYLANGDRVMLLANTGLQAAKSRATVEAGSLELWDSVTGRVAPARYEVRDGNVSFDVEQHQSWTTATSR